MYCRDAGLRGRVGTWTGHGAHFIRGSGTEGVLLTTTSYYDSSPTLCTAVTLPIRALVLSVGRALLLARYRNLPNDRGPGRFPSETRDGIVLRPGGTIVRLVARPINSNVLYCIVVSC